MRNIWGWVSFAVLVAAGAASSCAAGNEATTGSQSGSGGHAGSGGSGASTGSTGVAGNAGSGGGIDIDSGNGEAGPCPTITTCAEQGANCGPISDGCEGVLQCGDCQGNESCGGGGTPSVCGTPPCVPNTCADQNLHCGPAGDGCGNVLDCGTCVLPETCGGGGPGVCGNNQVCVPTTCADQGLNCGPAGDGCGNVLDCGTCQAPATCGGGGQPSVCGAAPCMPKTCADFGAKACGPLGNGCGGLIQCGACNAPETCGGVTPSQCGVPVTCTNLCLQQVQCPGNQKTTVTGTVYAPNGVDPLSNVLVYVPNAAVQPFAAGVACDNCSSGVSGSPLISAATDTAGHFTLTNVPVGAQIPLVIQTGRWRRQVKIPSVAACQNTALPASLTRLPKTKAEGDIPLMAFATGSVDALECLMRKVGVADSEFTQPNGTGRIHLYIGDGKVNVPGPGGGMFFVGGANAGAGTPSETTLVGTLATLKKYDMVLFPCKGAEKTRSNAELTNLKGYANAGGRVFTTHFSYVWLNTNAPFSGTALWNPGQLPSPADQDGFIDTSFPKGLALAQWLQNVGASNVLGQIPIQVLKHDIDGVVAPSQKWMSINNPNAIMHYTFNTPVGSPADQQCGRVLFDDFHVENHGYINQNSAYGMTFPAECDNSPMNAQEKLLEFMIFDLGSCVTPDIPVCNTTTCAAQGVSCGPAGDGCGGVLDCGPCPIGQSCGGGGTPSVCGSPLCLPTTCMAQNIDCGPAGDGCGNLIQCGTCPIGQSCGGGGMPGKCGNGVCAPTTCMAQNIDCGPAGDGCGNLIQCGMCPIGQSCGGGGVPGKCGSLCVPQTCASLGFNCGPAGDGCGAQLDCGVCSPPNTCGGGGDPNVCGGSIPN